MPDLDETVTVVRNDAESRYEIHLGDTVAGYTTFTEADGGRLIFDDTQIDDQYAGQGLGSTLLSEALADVARRGNALVPECSFTAKYLTENEVAGLVVDWPEEEQAVDAANPAESPG